MKFGKIKTIVTFSYLSIFLFTFTLTTVFAQEQPVFDHGNNNNFTPYDSYAIPVAQPTKDIYKPSILPIANKETGLPNKPIEAAHSGIHFPKGTADIQTVRYDLYVTDTLVNYTGKARRAMAVNGQLPAPTLSFTIGDTAIIYVHNYSSEPTSIHWHGVQLPERMDGVSFLTQMPIPPHTTYIYKFPVVQAGTYWYHSHFMLQEQIGIYGVLIFNKRTEPEIPTIPVVLSDWSNTKPSEIQRMLHTGNDWFGIKKHSVQSYWEALKTGNIGAKFSNEWKRMEAMDVSDVYYERFLLNGDTASQVAHFKAGDRIRLRVVNGSASSYFWLTYSGGKIMVVANDGNDVTPVNVDRLIIGPSETYDLVVTIPEAMRYEFLATAEDRSGSASLWLGSGMKMPAAPLPKLNYFAGMKMMNQMMGMSGNMKPMDMKMGLQKMDMNEVMYPELKNSNESQMHHHHGSEVMDVKTKYVCPMHPEVVSDRPGKCPKCGMELIKKEDPGMDMGEKDDNQLVTLNYNMLKATHNTELPDTAWRTLKFELTGNMNRYVWSINNKTVGESDKILIHQGENIRIILYNNTMMRHPMHLHGHDFRLVNQYGAYSPMKNVVDIMPMESDTLEFYASESGDWFFHCHILYHMMGGMGRIFHYANSPANPEIMHPKHAAKMLNMDERRFYFTAENDFATNGNDGSLSLSNVRWGFQGDWHFGYHDNSSYETGLKFGRYFGTKQWLYPYIGIGWRYRQNAAQEANWLGQTYFKDHYPTIQLGIQYTLPWLIVTDASIDYQGHALISFSREDIPLSPRLRAAFRVNSDKEYRVGAKYIILKNIAVSGNYDSDFGWGLGITVKY